MPQLASIAPPSLYGARPVRVWLVIGLFIIYLIVCFGILFGAVAPVANFRIQPAVAADAGAYWEASGVRTINFANQENEGANATGNLFGPVVEAEILRTDLNVALFNCALFLVCLWLLHGMPEFDRATFLMLMMANPFLIASLITLNKEIFALAGIVFFIRYTSAKSFRTPLLLSALFISLMARWQQTFVMILFVVFQSRLSPVRKRPWYAVSLTLLMFTVGYGLVYRLVPSFFAALLAQAEGGHTIVILDSIQAKFGFPLVVIPKILMNVLGRFITPAYFFHDYWMEDFTNWRDQIFLVLHTFLTTFLLLFLFFTRRLRIQHAPVLLLFYYLMMTAINPMVQPRYEYAAYVLLCLEASRYFRIGEATLFPFRTFRPLTL
jgi:hypothetical protein